MAFPSELQFESPGPARESFPFSPVHAAEDREFLSDSEDELSEIMSKPPAPPAKEEVKPLEIVMEPKAENLKRVVVDREKAEKPQANPPNWFDDIDAMMDQPESDANGQLHFGFDEDLDNFPSRESLHSKPEEAKRDEWKPKSDLMTAQRLPAGFSASQEEQRPLESEEKVKDDFFDALPDSNSGAESSLGDTESELARDSSVNSSHPSLAVVSASIELPAAKEDPAPRSFAPDSVIASLASGGKPLAPESVRPLAVSSGGNLKSFAPDPQELSSARDRGVDLRKGPDGGEWKPLSISSENPSFRAGDISGKASLNPATDTKPPPKLPVPVIKPLTFSQPIVEDPPTDIRPPAKSFVPDKNWAEADGDRPATTLSLQSPKLSAAEGQKPQFNSLVTKSQVPSQGPKPLIISDDPTPPDLSYKSPSSVRNLPPSSEVKPRVPLSSRAAEPPQVPPARALQVPEGPKKPLVISMSAEEPAGVSLASKHGKFPKKSEAPPEIPARDEPVKEEAKVEVKEETKTEEAKVPSLSSVYGMGRSLLGGVPKVSQTKSRVKFDEGSSEAPPEPANGAKGKLPPLRIAEDDPLPAPRKPEPQRKPEVQKPPLPAVKPPEKPESDNPQASAKPIPRVIAPRDSRLPKPEEEKKVERSVPDPGAMQISDGSEAPGIRNYSQVYDMVATEDVLAIPPEQPAPRGCCKALLSCFSSPHEIVVPDVKKAMTMLLGLSRRPIDPSKSADLSLLTSIWGHLLTNERFSLTGEGWVRLGFQSAQPLQQNTVGTLGLLQVLFALSAARSVALEMYGLATTRATAFPFVTTSLSVTTLALNFVKTGALNEYFDRQQNVKDVFNALYLGIFVSWVKRQQTSPGKVSLPDLEKEVRLHPNNFITEGKRQQH